MIADEELVLKIQSGDETAESELFSRYRDYVTKISRGYYIVGGEMEDLVQEGMIGLYRAVKSFSAQKDVKFKTYAVTCIKHQIQTAIKKSLTNKNKALSSSISLHTFDNDGEDHLPIELVFDISPAEQAINNEENLILRANINNCLSAFEIKILNLYLEGYSYKEISQRLDVDKKSIDNAISRIKNKLKEKLNFPQNQQQ